MSGNCSWQYENMVMDILEAEEANKAKGDGKPSMENNVEEGML